MSPKKMERGNIFGKPYARFELRKSEFEALKYLAASGASTAYSLPSTVAKSQRWAYRIMKRLTDLAYAEVENRGKTRAGLPMKFYKPTFWGLCNVLADAETASFLFECVKRWRSFDNVAFENVEGLVEAFGENEVYEAMKHAASEVAKGLWLDREDKRIGGDPMMVDMFRTDFFNHLINPVRFWEVEHYVPEWRLNKEVKEWLIKNLQSRRIHYEHMIDWVDRFMKALTV